VRQRLRAGVALAALLALALPVPAACGGADRVAAPDPPPGPTSPLASPTGGAPLEPTGTVTRHTDGDTLRISIDGTEEKVRLIGIDTPESVKPNSPVECFGKEAAAHLERLVPTGTPVRVVLDVEPRDRYGRLLAYVYRAADGLFVNVAMAADGYANVLTIPPNVAHTEDVRMAVTDARTAGRGLWSACAEDDPFA
jgi:micrococcal nuclease